MTISVLMVAEKPSIADSLAKALSRGRATQRKGVSPAVQVHEFDGTFQGKPAFIKITSCTGHVYSTDFPPQYQSWDKTDPVALFDAEVVKEESNPKVRLPAHFKAEAKGVSHLVLWLDCDREGENICFEVIRNVQPQLPNPKNVWRAKFSSLAPNDLLIAYDTLGYPNENESKSVDARQEIDLKIGVAFTRFQTRFFQGKYGDLDSALVSYGPCQTPTLWFCVSRHSEIQSFQPETFYTLDLVLQGDLFPQWDRKRVFDQKAAIFFKELLISESGGVAIVTSVVETEDRRTRPTALDTISLLKGASQSLGIGPQHCMHVAERLYLQGYITYPRTETSQYAPSFDLRAAVSAQTNSAYWGKFASELLSSSLHARAGKDAGDHPPITPVRSAHESDLDHDSWRVYEFVVRHFLASVSRDCKFRKIKMNISAGSEQFALVGRRLIDAGFTAVQRGEVADVELPKLSKGDRLEISSVGVSLGKTSPPPYLSESDLLSLMEKNGIGTDASMATHINNICERNFVKLCDPGRRLVPTKLGIVLINGYSAIDPELVTPRVRGEIESQCTLIALGKAKPEEVIEHTLKMFKQKFLYFLSQIEKMDSLFESSFTSLASTGRPLSRCGRCKKYMNLIDKKPVRLYCRHCDEAHALPWGGAVRLYKELTCPLDGFELVLISHPGTAGKSYPLCPLCYNDPPFGGAKKNCHECPHATCKHSLAALGVCACTQPNCPGTLCLDPESRPMWKFDCNTCNFQIKLPKDNQVHKISVLPETCSECSSSFLLKIEYHKDTHEGKIVNACIACDEELNSGIEGVFTRSAKFGANTRKGGKGRKKGGKREKNIDPRMTFDQF